MPGQRKRIVFVMPEANLTGSSICIFKIIEYLQANHNYDIHVIASKDGPLIEQMRQKSISVSVICKQSDSTRRASKYICRLLFYLDYLKMLRKFKPNIVFSNTIYNFGQVVLGKLFGTKTLVHVHEGRNAIAKVHWRLRITSIFTDKYIAVSHYVKHEVSKIVHRPVAVIYNGIELNTCPSSSTIRLVAGIIGTIDRNKSQLVAIKAVEHVIRQMDLTIALDIIGAVSDQKYFEEIQAYIKENNLAEYINLKGVIPGIYDIYALLDCVIVASTDEAFPLVNLEAMAAGKLLIASDTGGNPELIEDGVTGFLFNVGDHVDLANKLATALQKDDLCQQIVLNAKEKVSSKFRLVDMHQAIAIQIASLTCDVS